MTDFFEKQIQEIQSSLILKIYGAFLSFAHVLTFFYWNHSYFFINSQDSQNSNPLCYPFFSGCDILHQLIPTVFWYVILFFYLFVCLFSTWFFLSQNQIKKAYFLLFIGTFIKLTLYLSNYNFTDNHHFMIHLILLLYLFVPHKKINIKYLISAFHVAAGFSKINPDWLSASVPFYMPWVGDRFVLLIPVYVIFFEIFIFPSLLFTPRWFRWLTLLQLLVFHLLSGFTEVFYIPLLMLCLLSLFFMDEFFDFRSSVLKRNFNPKLLIKNFFTPGINDHLKLFFNGREKASVYICLFIFTLFQIMPSVLVSEPHLSGVPQLFSLNLSGSGNRCKALMVVHRQGGSFHLQKPVVRKPHLKCDPLIHLNQARQLCKKNKESGEFESLSLSLVSKRISENQYKKILNIPDVCQFKNPLWAELFWNKPQGGKP